MSIHEQARAEAEKVWPSSLYSEAVDWRAGFAKGFLAGHEAATRTRVVTTVTELDALPVGSVVWASGEAWRKYVNGWWMTWQGEARGANAMVLPARVLHDPEETR